MANPNTFTHLDENNRPQMVNVGGKIPTHRVAIARAILYLPAEVMAELRGNQFNTKKGSLFQTAILAGVMAAKKTADLIPLCHGLPLENCSLDIRVYGEDEIWIDCTASVTGKTGVEMEALTGASIAALTLYDMCKALSRDLVIREIRLLSKTGGKSDFTAK